MIKGIKFVDTEKLKRKWEKADELELDLGVTELLASAPGRRLLWWLLDIGRIGGQPFAQNSLITAFNCGELNVGQRILDKLLTVSPDGYVNLLKEKQNERNDRNDQLDRAADIDGGWNDHAKFTDGRDD